MTKNIYIALTTTCIGTIGNYSLLLILIVFTILIYYELRKTIQKRRLVMSKWSGIVLSSVTMTRIGIEIPSIFTLAKSNHLFIKSALSNRIESESSLRRSLIMCFWVSFFISIDRLLKGIYRAVLFFRRISVYTFYINAFSNFCSMVLFTSFFFVYMKSNRLFRKKFYKIFFRRND